MERQVLVKKVSADGNIGIPERFRTLFRIKAGDDVFWQMVEDGILIAKNLSGGKELDGASKSRS